MRRAPGAGRAQSTVARKSYLDVDDESSKPFVRTNTADEVLNGLARSRRRISDSGH
jgi:hypothetical protein